MTTTAPTMPETWAPEWHCVELTEAEHREYAREIKVAHWMENRTVEERVDMLDQPGCSFVVRQHILVELSRENSPECNCVGIDLSWAKVGEPRVVFVGDWKRGFVSVLAKDYPMDAACEQEARSVMRSLCS